MIGTIKKIRIDRLLSNLGICDRSKVQYYLNTNRVTVFGKKVDTPNARVNPDDIKIDGKPLQNLGPISIALHKPKGYISSTVPDGEHKVIYELLPEEFRNRKPILSIAGRLDKWVTGLVVMSQDGKLVDKIITPKDNGCGKDYEVRLKEKLQGTEKEHFESGTMMLRGEELPCKPAKMHIINPEENRIKVTLFEGRYHQIRRMCAAIENKALEIHRTRVGPVELGNLPLGKWRYLTKEELEELSKIQIDTIQQKKNEKSRVKENIEEVGEDEQEKELYNILNTNDESKLDQMEMEDEFKFEEFEEDLEASKHNSKDLNYDEKLQILINSEKTKLSDESLFNQDQLLKKIQEFKENQVKKSILNFDDEDDDQVTKSQYDDLRSQFHQKFRAQIMAIDKEITFDSKGRPIPKSDRVLDEIISDKKLKMMMARDPDFKEIQQRHKVKLEKEQQEQEEKDELQNQKLLRSNNKRSKNQDNLEDDIQDLFALSNSDGSQKPFSKKSRAFNSLKNYNKRRVNK
ncbi:hypothetical protein DLAC_08585 [Tieghemostelium lacteum]|uniref:Pseudouridine synthase RsuA/RluA-like domain-containing protein n=1 Tax=Tieghemostelium lacteum TaxID=361077 RepID=A0A151Z7S4_TIELA|nr:hypothetical protein DLAC_08585 [Tieghemostelium lacteum]|eukprot:KYQ90010.1 hypothetical protein DLAC_08585 [Tieghemostelium lacteum]